jgi:hypothetical protein
MAAVRLYINGDHSDFVRRVAEGDKLLLCLLMSSMAVQMVRSALTDETFSLSMAEENAGSLGGVIAGWIQQVFPNQALSTVRAKAFLDPAAFESALGALAPSPNGGADA